MNTLKGKLVTLRPPRAEDLEYLAALKNDLRTQAWSQRIPPKYTAEIIADRYKKVNEKQHAAVFAIDTNDGDLVGIVNFEEYHPRLSAVFGIATGVKYWGKGYATEAQELILEYLFVQRGVLTVRLWTQSGNEHAVIAAEKLGFRISSRMRESCIMDGEVTDNLSMDMLREEYFSSRGIIDNVGLPEPMGKM